MNNWFEVDKAGLAKILARKGLESAVFELIQNAWDEDGVTTVKVALMPSGHGRACLVVEDDAPAGFADLSHAFTLFAESKKKANPEKRGRFNLGEKLVLAICNHAVIATTTGTVVFDEKGRHNRREKTTKGSALTMSLRATKDDIARVAEKVKTLLVPDGIHLMFNGETIQSRRAYDTLMTTLPTEIADTEGNLVKSRRKTLVGVYGVEPGETATLYEMGIPVVETSDKYHYNIGQKVPLTMDRENVPPSFLNAVRVAVYNVLHDTITKDDVNEEWVQEAAASPHCGVEAAKHYVETKFGEKRVSFDPTDLEANNRAVANSYTVVHGAMMHKGAWENARNAQAIQPAGQVFPTHPKNFLPFDPAEITPGMREVADYAQRVSGLVLGFRCRVRFGKQPTRERACWGDCELQFNVANLGGPAWFDLKNNQEAIDDLLIHEFGHHYCANHLCDDYNDALTRIGAKMVRLAREGRI
jgi:hypothetical protein